VFGTSLFQISKNKAAQTGLNKQATWYHHSNIVVYIIFADDH
jgi:hypothetical protein